jgi:hypothetical protein
VGWKGSLGGMGWQVYALHYVQLQQGKQGTVV